MFFPSYRLPVRPSMYATLVYPRPICPYLEVALTCVITKAAGSSEFLIGSL